ncbi:MAG: bifunctional 4-hydroxy-2-oxoglutarate aldolase/2-dehydro-3-deoxy-phosphogluconate aldolase [Pseudomonadota bacterium]
MTPEAQSDFIRSTCGAVPVIPVIMFNEPDRARDLASALSSGGLTVLEVTLRTERALEIITEMATLDASVVVGAGTLLTARDVEAAKKAGAAFGVSPGASDAIIDAAIDVGLPLLPGAVTASEMMRLLDRGYSAQKFFPAEASGGAKALASFAAPLPQVSFCPTGGIGPANARDYLDLPNVMCVGGSWMLDKEAISGGDWPNIAKAARAASAV